MSNPVDVFLEARGSHEKTAEVKQANRGAQLELGKEVARGAIQGAMGVAAVALGGAAVKAFNAIKKRHSYREMMDHNPDLNEMQQSDPTLFNRHYASLYTMNPSFASDPVVAGTYMRQMSMSPATAGKALVESMEARQRTSPWEVGLTGGSPTVRYKF